MQVKRILIIGLVWPEPQSSAAGTRIVQLLKVFLEHQYEVVFASAASKSDFSVDLNSLGIREVPVKLNEDSFNAFIADLQPEVVMYDRYVTEEQFGWRVSQECPDALTILDTEDLHCLRSARQQAIKKTGTIDRADLYNDVAKREIASILRCDLSLIISPVEMGILTAQYAVDESLLYYLPFLEESLTAETTGKWRAFEEREGFMFIGNYLHEPNWHTLQTIKTSVWPIIRKQLPGVKMHVYGAYPGQKVMQLHNASEHFLIHGRAACAREVMSKHRILLAPLQFGAGVKGKFIDAMQSGTPAVTTSIGAEGMQGALPWAGIVIDDLAEFSSAAIRLYTEKDAWLKAQSNAINLINQHYAKDKFAGPFLAHLETLKTQLSEHRRNNFIGQILQHHTLNSLKYLSLWITEKNK